MALANLYRLKFNIEKQNLSLLKSDFKVHKMSISKLDKAIFNIRITYKAKSLFSSINIDFEGAKTVILKLVYMYVII